MLEVPCPAPVAEKQERTEVQPPRDGWLRAALAVVLLVLFPLKDARSVSAQADYDATRRLFLHGYLAESQQKADQGYKAFFHSQPEWSAKFRLQEAEAMVWRGMYDDALHLLAASSLAPGDPEVSIRRLTIESVALTHQEQLGLADQKLKDAERLCQSAPVADCGEVLRARGTMEIWRGDYPQAQRFFNQSLDFASAHNDRWLQAGALLNLGGVALREEHYDEALDWSNAAYRIAADLGAEDLAQVASGNLGWAYLRLGDTEQSLALFREAEKRAADLGDISAKLNWLKTAGYVYQDTGNLEKASQSYRQALEISRQLNSFEDILTSLEDLAHVSIDEGNLEDADYYLAQLIPVARATVNRLDDLDVTLAQAKIDAARREDQLAKSLFLDVERDPDSQISMRMGAEHELARLLETENDVRGADAMYRTALATFEAARSELKNEDSKLPFLTNASPIYDDYVHFLVSQGKPLEALEVADQSRARTLAQGLGADPGRPAFAPATLHPEEIARRSGATLLFYWLGARTSYLWTITPQKTAVFPLPSQAEIVPKILRYRRALLGPEDPKDDNNEDGRALYNMLVLPAARLIQPNTQVMLLTDGPLSQLNFETLLAPGAGPMGNASRGDEAHYWIDDVVVSSARSLSMLADVKPAGGMDGKLLLLGDAVSPNADYPELPMAASEMSQIERHFSAPERTVFTRKAANPEAYLQSRPAQYSYIHFVTHGVASRTDPLDSAIILSRTGGGEDSFKLHARDIIHHPIHARLVTISACYGSGARSYAGEGLVGLSWAFLRAGAQSVIAALWEASDESTPRLMDKLYQGLENGMSPADALRQAKLALLHSRSKFRKPFFWGSFQIFTA
ncbi:MAG TPA: CHAT domain-containing protein [Terracidiphilus sp.]|nr:CHAT domain-containing protein [Terracidiphilus sp.]